MVDEQLTTYPAQQKRERRSKNREGKEEEKKLHQMVVTGNHQIRGRYSPLLSTPGTSKLLQPSGATF